MGKKKGLKGANARGTSPDFKPFNEPPPPESERDLGVKLIESMYDDGKVFQGPEAIDIPFKHLKDLAQFFRGLISLIFILSAFYFFPVHFSSIIIILLAFLFFLFISFVLTIITIISFLLSLVAKPLDVDEAKRPKPS